MSPLSVPAWSVVGSRLPSYIYGGSCRDVHRVVIVGQVFLVYNRVRLICAAGQKERKNENTVS
jgi:hypothetical protein